MEQLINYHFPFLLNLYWDLRIILAKNFLVNCQKLMELGRYHLCCLHAWEKNLSWGVSFFKSLFFCYLELIMWSIFHIHVKYFPSIQSSLWNRKADKRYLMGLPLILFVCPIESNVDWRKGSKSLTVRHKILINCFYFHFCHWPWYFCF